MLKAVVGVIAAAVLLIAGAATAQDDDHVDLDRLELSDGYAEVSVSRRLDGRTADFGLAVSRTYRDGDVVSDTGGELLMPVRLADRKRHARLRVARLRCETPVGVVGTITRRVARVEIVAGDGSVIRLRRQRPPSGWGLRGFVIGEVRPSVAAVRLVRARLRGGKVVARVRPEPARPCPQ